MLLPGQIFSSGIRFRLLFTKGATLLASVAFAAGH